MHSYFAEIGYNRVSKVLNCSLKMAPVATRSALQTVQEKPATGPGERNSFPPVESSHSAGLSGQLVLLQQQEEGGRKETLWLLRLQSGSQARQMFCCSRPRRDGPGVALAQGAKGIGVRSAKGTVQPRAATNMGLLWRLLRRLLLRNHRLCVTLALPKRLKLRCLSWAGVFVRLLIRFSCKNYLCLQKPR